MTTIAIAGAVFMLVTIGVGLYASRFTRGDAEDYFLAGRTLGPWVSALSAGASGSSAWVTMGLVGLGFSSGVRAYWLIPGTLIGIGFGWLVMARPLRRESERLGAVTIPDLLAMRFGERLPVIRLMSVVVILSAMFLYVAAQMAAAGQAFAATFDGLDYAAGVMIGGGVVLIYTVAGGFRATCWTDALQALLMLMALVGLPIVILIAGGVPESPLATLREAEPGGTLASFLPETSGLALIGFLLGAGALGVNLGYPGQPHVLVRFMALESERSNRMGAAIHMGWSVLIYTGAVTTGWLTRAAAEHGQSWATGLLDGSTGSGELAMIAAATNLLPAALAGLVLAAILSAMASTADSQLIVAASAVSSDTYARLTGRTGTRLNRLLNRGSALALGIGAVVMVLVQMDQEVKIYDYVLTYGWAMLGASFGPQIILAMLWKRASYAGCVAGMGTGFATTILWKQLYDAEATGIEAYNLTVAFGLALIVNVVVSLALPDRARPEA